MSDRILLGETRRDAISRVQEQLGPATSRPLAEKTFWELARKGRISMDKITGDYLIEADAEAEVKTTAEGIVSAENSQKRGINYNVNRSHFHRARVAWQWKARQTAFAPSLQGAGVQLLDSRDDTIVPPDKPNPDSE